MSTSRPDLSSPAQEPKEYTVVFDDGVEHNVGKELFDHISKMEETLQLLQFILMLKDAEISQLKKANESAEKSLDNSEEINPENLMSLIGLIAATREAAKNKQGTANPSPERILPPFAGLFGNRNLSSSSDNSDIEEMDIGSPSLRF